MRAEVVLLGYCPKCDRPITSDDEDPEVPGLAYCPYDGHPVNYDR
jgi:hypothetical protein